MEVFGEAYFDGGTRGVAPVGECQDLVAGEEECDVGAHVLLPGGVGRESVVERRDGGVATAEDGFLSFAEFEPDGLAWFARDFAGDVYFF